MIKGVKLDPESGANELDEELLKEIKAQIGGRRGRKPKAKRDKKKEDESASKRPRVDK